MLSEAVEAAPHSLPRIESPPNQGRPGGIFRSLSLSQCSRSPQFGHRDLRDRPTPFGRTPFFWTHDTFNSSNIAIKFQLASYLLLGLIGILRITFLCSICLPVSREGPWRALRGWSGAWSFEAVTYMTTGCGMASPKALKLEAFPRSPFKLHARFLLYETQRST